jgi:hypothetical protein
MTRQCGECSLCCRLLPVQELRKKAGERCKHQRLTGCRIYVDRPPACRLWSCRWLLEDDVAGLPRPDRSGYVIDIMPDYVLLTDEAGKEQQVSVVQIWCDPKRPDAWRTPDVKAYIQRRFDEDNMATIVRYSNVDAITVFAPGFFANHDRWVERHSTPNFKLKPWEAWQQA